MATPFQIIDQAHKLAQTPDLQPGHLREVAALLSELAHATEALEKKVERQAREIKKLEGWAKIGR